MYRCKVKLVLKLLELFPVNRITAFQKKKNQEIQLHFLSQNLPVVAILLASAFHYYINEFVVWEISSFTNETSNVYACTLMFYLLNAQFQNRHFIWAIAEKREWDWELLASS